MARSRSTVSLQLGDRLRDSPMQTTTLSLPIAVHHRLDELADLATDVRASRAELVAMLIAGAELDAAGLEERMLAYRRMRVRDVIPRSPDQSEDENVVVLPVRQPGRPTQRRARG
jgi:hypothetical protein